MGAGEGAGVPVPYLFYRDEYGGALGPEDYAEAMPAALRCVRVLCGTGGPGGSWGENELLAWKRAVCAAAEAFAEFGEGCVGGYAIGDFKVTNYMEKGTTGREVAAAAAADELAGTGLLFSGVS